MYTVIKQESVPSIDKIKYICWFDSSPFVCLVLAVETTFEDLDPNDYNECPVLATDSTPSSLNYIF